MRSGGAALLRYWLDGGPFTADDGATHAIVTVERDWFLNTHHSPGTYRYPPVRWFQRADNSQVETVLPNIKSIQIDRSIDDVAASATIEMYNQWMDLNFAGKSDELGYPGHFTWQRGASPEAFARWGHSPNEWANVLVPEAMLRTYQGYGGRRKSLQQCLADGNLVLTGVWLIDDVRVSTSGIMSITCRDVGKLLVEQQSYPPLVPRDFYPVDFRRWKHDTVQVVNTTTRIEGNPDAGDKPFRFAKSGNQAWAGASGCVHGHCPVDAMDGDPGSYWLSIGNSSPKAPYAIEWIEIDVGGQNVDSIYVSPWAGNYRAFISVMENGVWQGTDTIDYNPQGIGRYHSGYNAEYESRIAYVLETGIPWESPTEIRLPRSYAAQRIRITLDNLVKSPYGPPYYRGGLREIVPRVSGNQPREITETTITNIDVISDGNFVNYDDIVRHYLLWSGWYLYDPANPNAEGFYNVHGNIEGTGIPGNDQTQDWIMPKEMFDKRPVADVINQIKEIVGYIFFTDEEGAVRFESPNWWGPGNFFENGTRTSSMFEIDERHLLTDYTAQFSGSTLRSEIIIATVDPEADSGLADTVTTRFTPPTASLLRGQVRPAMWVNGNFINKAEQQTMAELISMHIWFQQRTGSATIVANPLIQPNDQVRIFEKQTAESYIHYVRRISSSQDLETGKYTMSLTTNWLGSESSWALAKPV